MPNVVEEIPVAIRAEVDAALAWLNAERGSSFRVTGIVDPEDTLTRRKPDGPIDLGLVLCQGDLCVREFVRVQKLRDAFECSAIPDATPSQDLPAHLDPPAGVRKGWLDEQLSKHAFVVLLFYRGFW